MAKSVYITGFTQKELEAHLEASERKLEKLARARDNIRLDMRDVERHIEDLYDAIEEKKRTGRPGRPRSRVANPNVHKRRRRR